jgi:hypothetical protein
MYKHCGGLNFNFQNKRWHLAIKLHGVTSHRIVFLIFITLRHAYKPTSDTMFSNTRFFEVMSVKYYISTNVSSW